MDFLVLGGTRCFWVMVSGYGAWAEPALNFMVFFVVLPLIVSLVPAVCIISPNGNAFKATTLSRKERSNTVSTVAGCSRPARAYPDPGRTPQAEAHQPTRGRDFVPLPKRLFSIAGLTRAFLIFFSPGHCPGYSSTSPLRSQCGSDYSLHSGIYFLIFFSALAFAP